MKTSVMGKLTGAISYFSLLFVHKGVHVDQTLKKYFLVEVFVQKFHHTCIHLGQPYKSEKKKKKGGKKNLLFQNGGQNTDFNLAKTVT